MGKSPKDSERKDGTLVGESDRATLIAGVDLDSKVQFLKVTPTGSLDTSQLDLFNIFNDILKELKKINFHLSLITDTCITNKDVEI